MIRFFFMSFVQVGLVALNTKFIAVNNIVAVFSISVLISLVYSFNITRIVCSNLKERMLYALGAGCGAVVALTIF